MWNYADKNIPDRAECASYELYVCTVRKVDQPEAKRLWQRIGGKDIPGKLKNIFN